MRTSAVRKIIVVDPTKRFSNRVENYVKYRPGYPPEVIDLLKSECGLSRDSVVADIGSGTGLLSELFLKQSCKVFCVEPNAQMRAAGEKLLAKYPECVSLNGAAEKTTLNDRSVDFIVCGQSFHWFDRVRAKEEFQRILKRDGWVVLVWNGFRVEKSALIRGYQQIVLKYGTDYQEVRREVTGLNLETFFSAGAVTCARFAYQQLFDFEGLRGRLLSASYAPEADHPSFSPMIEELRRLFDATQQDGKVRFDYDTEVYYGKI